MPGRGRRRGLQDQRSGRSAESGRVVAWWIGDRKGYSTNVGNALASSGEVELSDCRSDWRTEQHGMCSRPCSLDETHVLVAARVIAGRKLDRSVVRLERADVLMGVMFVAMMCLRMRQH